MVPEAGVFFWQKNGSEYGFSIERYKRIVYTVRIAVDRCFTAARLVRV